MCQEACVSARRLAAYPRERRARGLRAASPRTRCRRWRADPARSRILPKPAVPGDEASDFLADLLVLRDGTEAESAVWHRLPHVQLGFDTGASQSPVHHDRV